jgi:hypothetical protein
MLDKVFILAECIINMVSEIFGLSYYFISIIFLVLSAIIIVVSLGLKFIVNRKSVEEKTAEKILKQVNNIKNGKPLSSKEKNSEKKKSGNKKEDEETDEKEKKESVGEKKVDSSLKEVLIKKFKPKIESQLKTRVNILEIKGKDSRFDVLVEVSGVKITLILDSSGKIIDYKREK